MDMQKAWNDLDDAVCILESNIRSFREGNVSVYKVIAVQLRVLLCDKQNPLLPRVCREVRLHPLWGSKTKEQTVGLVFTMPTMVSPKGKSGPETARLFDESREPIELKEWLDQALFSQRITIRELIDSVRNKEAAHSDRHYNETLKLTRGFSLVGDEKAHIICIVVIGEYILEQIKMALEDNASESSKS